MLVYFPSQFSTVHLQQLRETIKGRKCEVHVSSVLGASPIYYADLQNYMYYVTAETDEVEDKISQMSLSTKVRNFL